MTLTAANPSTLPHTIPLTQRIRRTRLPWQPIQKQSRQPGNEISRADRLSADGTTHDGIEEYGQQLVLPGLEAHLPQDAVPDISGLDYHDDWLSPAQEQKLLARLDQEPWEQIWQRRTLFYGPSYRSGRFTVNAMPGWLQGIGDALAMDGLLPQRPRACGVNEYLPGQGIAPHHDDGPDNLVIAIVSLGTAVRFEMRQPDTGHRELVTLRQRSVLTLTGEAHTQWQHGMAGRLNDFIDGKRHVRERRVSLTFRA